ncbi:DUF6527 family protein [Rufibacter hautae]|uniref:Uncharacterized protein n=1 Tax=Rufibacter hautae TaxID=2595005 RepID=A0A5B6T9Z8_9BACT|nr:DUF6527 family protein [Rufibacter hautae]KAA3435923.1 hypothetical protein FOA19_23035 [Rufibacter hautae]
MKNADLKHEFVEFIPRLLEDGILYVSMTYATAAHNCCCGCGNKVITPLTPTDWKLTYNGESISITPSIGNWSFPCQSHYWIKWGRIKWSGQWSPEEIAAGRDRDRLAKKVQFKGADSTTVNEKAIIPALLLPVKQSRGFWRRIWEKLTVKV